MSRVEIDKETYMFLRHVYPKIRHNPLGTLSGPDVLAFIEKMKPVKDFTRLFAGDYQNWSVGHRLLDITWFRYMLSVDRGAVLTFSSYITYRQNRTPTIYDMRSCDLRKIICQAIMEPYKPISPNLSNYVEDFSKLRDMKFLFEASYDNDLDPVRYEDIRWLKYALWIKVNRHEQFMTVGDFEDWVMFESSVAQSGEYPSKAKSKPVSELWRFVV